MSETEVTVNRPRLEALMRWLLDEGHMTPVAVRQLNNVLDDEAQRRIEENA